MPDTAVVPPFRFLLSAGGIPLIASGLVFGLWAIWNLIKPPRERWILAQILLSLIPRVAALIAIYAAAQELAELAVLETAPKPATIATVGGRAMSYGFFGLLSTLFPVSLGAVGLIRKISFGEKRVSHED